LSIEFTTDKVLYDLLIATVTGIGTGLFIDYPIARRDKIRFQPTKSLLYARLADIVRDILNSHQLMYSFYEPKVQYYNLSSIAESPFPLELKDKSLFEKDSTSQRRSKEIAAKRLLENTPHGP
jgi:hypothetical protein